jgi:hypothetical protein
LVMLLEVMKVNLAQILLNAAKNTVFLKISQKIVNLVVQLYVLTAYIRQFV